MNKKAILFFLIFILAGASFFYFFKIKKEKPSASIFVSEIQAVEGAIKKADKEGLSLETSLLTDNITEREKITTEKYLFAKNVEFFLLSQELKSEEDFRQEEKEYNNWLKQDKTSMTIDGYRDAPDWRVQQKIKLTDLKEGDQVRILFYKGRDNQPFIFRLVIKTEPKNEDAPLVEATEQEIEIYGQIGEVANGQIALKDNSYAPEKDLVIIMSTETGIIKKIQKTEAEFRKEENEFREKLLMAKEKGEDTSRLVPPDWFFREKTTINALKPGLEVKILAIVASEVKAKSLEFISK